MTRDTLSLAWKSWFSSDLEPPGPAWLQWVITGVFGAIVAGCFTLLGMAFNAMGGGRGWTRPEVWLLWFGKNLVVSLLISYLIHTLFALLIPAIGNARIQAWSNARRSIFFTAVPIVGVMIGWPIGAMLVHDGATAWFLNPRLGTLAGALMFSVLISFIFFQVFDAKSRQVVAERRAIEAQLKLLQAQMEPHFLFNTLAGIQTLIDVEPERAKRMLESFTDYLRATVASLRTDQSTLGEELALAKAYLGLMQQRMEDRLAFSVDVDAGLHDVPMPALLLQPLVENAIHHGLEPKLEGGHVHIRARRDGDALRLEVQDDGLGPGAPRRRGSGNGVALDNIRQRLAGRWGPDAALDLQPQQPGTRATLRFPLDTARAR
jgi:signal transduction histidine kinase